MKAPTLADQAAGTTRVTRGGKDATKLDEALPKVKGLRDEAGA